MKKSLPGSTRRSRKRAHLTN